MFDKVISKIVMDNNIFNVGGSLTLVFKKQPLFQMWNIGSNIKQRFYITIGCIFYD